jgi:DNA (cytosine-5)-methyltransferase 1
MENVGAITFRRLDAVLGSLAEIGYNAEWQDIRAEDMGAPHRRERIWIVAYPTSDRWTGERQTSEIKKGLQQKPRYAGELEIRPKGCSVEMADTDKQGLQRWDGEIVRECTRQRTSRKSYTQEADRRNYWAVEPDVGRLANGIPNRLDRLKGLGNAIVPQIAELLFRQIQNLI